MQQKRLAKNNAERNVVTILQKNKLLPIKVNRNLKNI